MGDDLHATANYRLRVDEISEPADLTPGISRRTALAGAGGIAALLGLGLPLASSTQAQAVGAWGGYSNGEIPVSALASVPARLGPYLRPDAANAYNALNGTFYTHFGKPLNITEAYRSYATQQSIFLARYHAVASSDIVWNGQHWAKNAGVAVAAVPGTSNHGWGLAADFAAPLTDTTSTGHIWMRANASAYGWTWAGSAFDEPWHWEYNGTYTSTPEDDLPLNDADKAWILSAVQSNIRSSDLVVIQKSTQSALVGRHFFRNLNSEQFQIAIATFDLRTVTDHEWDVIVNDLLGVANEQPGDFSGIYVIQDTTRSSLIGPNFRKDLNSAQFQAAIVTHRLFANMSAADFDLHLLINGVSAGPTTS